MRRRIDIRGPLLVAAPVLIIVLFIGLPMVSGVLYSLGDTGGFNATIAAIGQHQHVSAHGWLTPAAYQEVFADPRFLASLWATAWVTAVSTAVVMVLAWTIAMHLRFHDGPLARAVAGVSVVPLFIPAVIGAYSILTFYAPNGFLRTAAHLVGWSDAPVFSYTLVGVVLGSVWSNLPFAVLLIASGLAAVPQGLIEAAQDVGAAGPRRFRSVLLPMTAVPTIIAATFTSIGILGSFTLPYVVGPTARNLLGPLMSDTYSAFNMPQQAQVMATVVFLLASLSAVAYIRANFRGSARAAR